MTESTQDEEGTDFAVTLYALNKGRTHAELTELLREISKAVVKTSKPGKLQLTLSFKPQKGTDAMFVTADVKASKPKFDPAPSIFWATETGDLVRNDPTQQPLFTEITTTRENTK